MIFLFFENMLAIYRYFLYIYLKILALTYDDGSTQ
jgi:hypothetical protein